VFATMPKMQMPAELLNMIGGEGCTVGDHAAARGALSVRLSTVQIPSIPGRHSALWRDHATSAVQWPSIQY